MGPDGGSRQGGVGAGRAEERGGGATPAGRARGPRSLLAAGLIAAGLALAGCAGGGDSENRRQAGGAESCMTCHNGSPDRNDYSGPGLEDPHPFGQARGLRCTTCHGGDGKGADKTDSHVPPPPEIGDAAQLAQNRESYFNRLTLTGIDKFPDYSAGGRTYTALDYLRFVNPGDLRVVRAGEGCGKCHGDHGDAVSRGLLATEAGILSGAMFAIGVDNRVPASQGLHQDTAVDLGFRAVSDATVPGAVGAVGELREFPVISQRNGTGPDALHNNPLYDSNDLPNDLEADNQVVTGSRLANLFHEQVAFTCGDCHLGSAGANNRYGDFRSSGCTACHMPYSLSGRSGSGDPNVNTKEPLDPDNIRAPERSHVRRHLVASVAKTLPGGEFVQGMDDYTCAGCHQGSNRTVMQYWGIRLDQNQDLRRGVQYPANPVSFQTTKNDTRLFDPVVGNRTFNGRNANQYILFEDYDGDGRDDTPPDVHYDAGLGCIDCHGSYDLHGGDVKSGNGTILSRMEQAVAIRCESCHGTADAYAATVTGTAWDGTTANLAVDSAGNPLPHVVRDGNGDYFLRSRLTGRMHYVRQTRDTVVDTGKRDPASGQPIYSEKASYAMGRADGDAATGIGPHQQGGITAGFSHMDAMSCAACHSSWTNSCIGCHLEGEYNGGNNFSNITGERIVFRERFADFVYQSPVPFQLGVGPDDKIAPIAANTDVFFRYKDLNGTRSQVFAFSDRSGSGNNTARAAHPSLAHNVMLPHSIRGRVEATKEGPRYCVACHLTDDGLGTWRSEYDTFRAAMSAGNYGALDFNLLQTHIGRNPSNQLDSPIWVHQVAGLGSGLFLFDEQGRPVNPLDGDTNRRGSNGVAPASIFDPARARLNLDRIVDETGLSTGASTSPLLIPGAASLLRDGSLDPGMSGPLGARLLRLLADPDNGIVLDAWIDADGALRGNASTFVQNP